MLYATIVNDYAKGKTLTGRGFRQLYQWQVYENGQSLYTFGHFADSHFTEGRGNRGNTEQHQDPREPLGPATYILSTLYRMLADIGRV